MSKFDQVEKELNSKFPVPAPLSWKVKPYGGNYDDGIYPDGTRVTVGITVPVKILWKTFRPYKTGIVVPLADPRIAEAKDIIRAAEYAYTHWSMKERVLNPNEN